LTPEIALYSEKIAKNTHPETFTLVVGAFSPSATLRSV